VVEKEPLKEEAHVSLMRLQALCGRNREALAQYDRIEGTLREVGAKPAVSSRALREEIASGRFPPQGAKEQGVGSEGPASTAGKHNLPAPRTSFVGRERERLEVKRELAMTRLLTLTGAGGSGKTRLALEVARDLVGAYPDGVWLGELASLSDAELVARAVAEALGVQEQPGVSLTDSIVDTIRDKRTLLVLDNCEHLVSAVAGLVDFLLDGCPNLRVLATSREPLGVPGEALWRVSPLSIPGVDRPPPVAQLTRYDAVRLFLDRARLRLPRFDLTSDNAPAMAEVCTRLEGMPLAVELAAARVGALLGRADLREAEGPPWAALRRTKNRALPAADHAGHARLELRAALGGREATLQAALGLRRRLDARGRRSGGLGCGC
jgi:predicted ATPase